MEEFAVRGTGGIQQYVKLVLGSYDPIDPSSMAGADWEYIFTAVIFCITLYCVLRIIGSLFK